MEQLGHTVRTSADLAMRMECLVIQLLASPTHQAIMYKPQNRTTAVATSLGSVDLLLL